MTRILSERDRQVLEALEQEPQSTKALLDNLDGFADRTEISVFLNGMMRDGLIFKQSNGYWKVQKGAVPAEPKTEEIPVFTSGSSDTIPAFARTEAQLKIIEELKIEETPPTKSQSRIEQDTIEQAISSLQNYLPINCSLVIAPQGIVFRFDGGAFAIKAKGDLDAAMRMQERFIGEEA